MAQNLRSPQPLSYLGVRAPTPPNLVTMRARPTDRDGINFQIGDLWVIPEADFGPTQEVWMLVGKQDNIMKWVQLDQGAIPIPLDVLNGGTGVSTIPIHGVMIGDDQDPINTVIGNTNTVLLGQTAADPVFGQVPNAALQFSYIGINSGNNITVTGSPVDLGNFVDIDLTGTTNHAVQIGNAAGSLTSLSVGTDGQVMLGATAADPSWHSPTAGTGLTLTSNATTLEYALTIPVTVPLGGTGDITLLDHGVLLGAGTSPINTTAVGATNTVLLGNTGADPSFGQVPNAALQNSTITLNDGNNITVTGSPIALGGAASIAVTGTTNHALQLGNASGSLTSMSVGTNGQIPLGATGADPSWVTPTAGTGLTLTSNATTLQYALTIPVVVSSGGTGATTLTNHGVLLGQGTSPIVATAVGTNGQLLIGSTGADPAFATVTSSDSTITFTTGANSLGMIARASSTTQTGVVELATDAEVQTGTSTSLVSPISSMVYHQGMAKAWVKFNSAGTIQDSYGVSSVSKGGTGTFTVNWSTNFANANYCIVAIAGTSSPVATTVTAQAVGSCTVLFSGGSVVVLGITLIAGGAIDPTNGYVAAFGDW